MFDFPQMANSFPIDEPENRKFLVFNLRSVEESNFLLAEQVSITQLSCFTSKLFRLDVKLLNSFAI